jgi:hypothetical protein
MNLFRPTILFAVLAVAGCATEGKYTFDGLTTGISKTAIIRSWGQPAVIARKLETQLGDVLEIYQYEAHVMGESEPDRYTLYFKDDKLLYWNKANWRGESPTERVPMQTR